ncbi:MAG TPA: tetratricopeptide repeat protein, partial [Candidatus Obscuribacterales bacterium]
MSAGNLIKKANQLKRQGELDQAIAIYQEAIKLNPDFAWTYYELGDALAKSGDLDNSVIYLQKSTVLKPNFYLAYEKLANIFHEQGKIDLAIAEYGKAKNSQNLQLDKKLTSSLEQYLQRVENYKNAIENLYEKKYWLDYPLNVSIETFSSCNAACNFCPYPSLDRKGTKMSEDLFKKIIDELSEPKDYVLPSINLTRVNEPFLDKRIFEFMSYVNAKLPLTKIKLFTNASLLDEKKLDQLLEIKNFGSLTISFNDHRPVEYEKVMQIPFKR